jgi:hypothetical protein
MRTSTTFLHIAQAQEMTSERPEDAAAWHVAWTLLQSHQPCEVVNLLQGMQERETRGEFVAALNRVSQAIRGWR